MSVKSLLEEIQVSLVKTNDKGEEKMVVSASGKDEERVMREMLNDREYKVDLYNKNGKAGEYCPAEDARSMVAGILSSAAKVSSGEAQELANSYDFGKPESQSMINISKEFVNTYLESGRKLPLGGRATSNVALSKVSKAESQSSFPKKSEDGKSYESVPVTIPPHDSVKVHAGCPVWLKK